MVSDKYKWSGASCPAGNPPTRRDLPESLVAGFVLSAPACHLSRGQTNGRTARTDQTQSGDIAQSCWIPEIDRPGIWLIQIFSKSSLWIFDISPEEVGGGRDKLYFTVHSREGRITIYSELKGGKNTIEDVLQGGINDTVMCTEVRGTFYLTVHYMEWKITPYCAGGNKLYFTLHRREV